VKHFSRRGIKRERCGDRIEGLGALDGGAKNRLMAQMDAIEVANGQNTGMEEKADSLVDRAPAVAAFDTCETPCSPETLSEASA